MSEFSQLPINQFFMICSFSSQAPLLISQLYCDTVTGMTVVSPKIEYDNNFLFCCKNCRARVEWFYDSQFSTYIIFWVFAFIIGRNGTHNFKTKTVLKKLMNEDDWYYSQCYAANLQCSHRCSDYANVVCYSANAVCKGGSACCPCGNHPVLVRHGRGRPTSSWSY
jgi:hypothetical protein